LSTCFCFIERAQTPKNAHPHKSKEELFKGVREGVGFRDCWAIQTQVIAH